MGSASAVDLGCDPVSSPWPPSWLLAIVSEVGVQRNRLRFNSGKWQSLLFLLRQSILRRKWLPMVLDAHLRIHLHNSPKALAFHDMYIGARTPREKLPLFRVPNKGL